MKMSRQDFLEWILCSLCIAWLWTSVREVGPWHVRSTLCGRVMADYWTWEKPEPKPSQRHSDLEFYRLTNELAVLFAK